MRESSIRRRALVRRLGRSVLYSLQGAVEFANLAVRLLKLLFDGVDAGSSLQELLDLRLREAGKDRGFPQRRLIGRLSAFCPPSSLALLAARPGGVFAAGVAHRIESGVEGFRFLPGVLSGACAICCSSSMWSVQQKPPEAVRSSSAKGLYGSFATSSGPAVSPEPENPSVLQSARALARWPRRSIRHRSSDAAGRGVAARSCSVSQVGLSKSMASSSCGAGVGRFRAKNA